jgi:hypothetical protein
VRRILLTLSFAALVICSGRAQILYSESFDEANGATSGTAGGTIGGSWDIASSPGGTFSVQGGSFRVNGTTTTGEWRTNDINISSAGYAILDVTFFAVGLFDDDDRWTAYYELDNSGDEIQFADFQAFLIDAETQGSAIVSGNTVKIIIRGFDNSPTIFGTGYLTFDDVTVTAADVLYSRKSGTWTDMTGGFGGTGTWSTSRTGTPACGCVPLNDMVAVIQNTHTVTLPTSQTAVGDATTPNLAPGAVDVESGGILQYNVNGVTLGIQEGLFRVRSGGVVNSSAAGITGEAVAFNANIGGAMFRVDAGGTVTLEDFRLDAGATNLHYLNVNGTLTLQDDITLSAPAGSLTIFGAGSITVGDDIVLGADDAIVINNLSTTLPVTGDIAFSSSTRDAFFTNNQTITANSVSYDFDDDTFINTGTLTLQTINVVADTDDGNTFTNSGTLNLNSTTVGIDPNASDFEMTNTGTVNQAGNFGSANGDLVAGANIVNGNGGSWYWTLNSNTIYTTFASAINFSTTGNTVYYSGTSNQNIAALTYYNLVLSTGGTKTASALVDVNGSLTVETSTISAAGTNAYDVEGSVTINGSGSLTGTGNLDIGGSFTINGTGTSTVTGVIDVLGNIAINSSGVLGGTGSISVGGSWSATSASSFTEGTRAVTFDGAGGQTLQNAAGTESFYTLIIDTNANADLVTLNDNVIVSNTLTLTQGRLALSDNTLYVTRAATGAISGGSAASYVISETTAAPYGQLSRVIPASSGTYTFPFGTSAGSYIPYLFVRTAGSGTISAATYTTPNNNQPFPSTVTHVANGSGVDQSSLVINRFWMVNVTSGTPTGTQSLAWAAAENDASTTPRTAQRWNGTDTWLAGSGTGNVNPYVIAAAALPTSGIWVVASTSAALPVEWLDFTAVVNDDEVHVRWKTASELNNDYFTVERTNNIETFEAIATQDGKGDSHTVSAYHVVDPSPLFGTSYYRIKQTDVDGTVSHSNIVKVVYEGPSSPVLHAFPSPGSGSALMIEINGLRDGSAVPLEILNSQGAVVFRQTLPHDKPQKLKRELQFSEPLAPGLYIVKAGPTARMTRKIVVK